MRVLFASTRGAGHFNPLVPFSDACRCNGHEVLVAGPPDLAPAVEAAGYPFRTGAEFASAAAAELAGIPHVRVAVGLAATEEESLAIAATPLAEASRSSELEVSIRTSPYLSLFPASVDDPPIARTRRFRDPAADVTGQPLPEWWDDGDAPLVYVTFGSVAGGMPMGLPAYRAALAAVAGLPVRVLLTIGREADPDSLGAPPANVHVEPWVAQADVLGHAAAVVGHGGAGTTLGSLAAGVPQVVVPLFADQPENAARVAAVGAGLVAQPEPASVRDALQRVLGNDSYRAAAARIAAEMRALPPVDDALAAL